MRSLPCRTAHITALVGRFIITTDDAYVRANNTIIGARVAGHIASIAPKDNATVKAGDLLIKIDDGDYKIAVDAARAKIATQGSNHRADRPAGRRAGQHGGAGQGAA